MSTSVFMRVNKSAHAQELSNRMRVCLSVTVRNADLINVRMSKNAINIRK